LPVIASGTVPAIRRGPEDVPTVVGAARERVARSRRLVAVQAGHLVVAERSQHLFAHGHLHSTAEWSNSTAVAAKQTLYTGEPSAASVGCARLGVGRAAFWQLEFPK